MKLWYLADVRKVLKLPWVFAYRQDNTYYWKYTRNESRNDYMITKTNPPVSIFIQKIPNTILHLDIKKPLKSRGYQKIHTPSFYYPLEGIYLPQAKLKINKTVILEEGLYFVELV